MIFKQARLENGLEVVAELNETARSTAAGFFVKTGSRDESDELAGVSHFLEHMVFKGTPTRDAIQVNRDFDKVGAKHNAQTSEEDTIYHAACLPEYLPATLDVLADLLRPTIRAEDFETEKKVIVEEIRMYLDNPMMVAYEAAKHEHHAPHPLGQSVLGTIESIEALTVEQMKEYFERRYGPSNIVLAFAGNANWDELVALAESRCGDWKGPTAERVAVQVKGNAGFRAIERPEDTQQTLILAADAPAIESDDRHAASLLATILGDHTGSKLYWELIDPGYADGAEVSYQDYNNAGVLYTFLSCEPGQAQENLERIARVYRQTTEDGPTAEELEQARNKVLARSVLRGERPMGRLMSLGLYWTYRREYVSVDRDIERFAAVTLDDLRRVLKRYPLLPTTLVSVGPSIEIVPIN